MESASISFHTYVGSTNGNRTKCAIVDCAAADVGFVSSGPQRWVWEELRDISGMRWRYQEEEEACEYVTRLAAALGWVEHQHVLMADYMHEAWEPEQVCLGVVYIPL